MPTEHTVSARKFEAQGPSTKYRESSASNQTVYLEGPMRTALLDRAKRLDVSVSEVVRTALREYLLKGLD